ncbi:MAG TPA: RecX family transcriptional regulator [Candidatus Saccharimonadales bacterium]|nr:RecX family transcriptional regulator [Candidatus Saccharimonadales bacterium]
MNITAIQQQVRRAGRYSIYVDQNYAFSLSADVLLNEKLYVGQELDAVQLKTYKKLSADDKAYSLALAYVVRRMRSRFELTDYFRRKGYDAALNQQILDRLTGLGLVDDQKFAEAWVRNRRLLKPVSRRRLVQELRQKRVADDIINQVLAADQTSEAAVLRELIERKRKQSRYQDNLKLMRYLVGQGFGYDAVKTALKHDGQDAL